jgi:hypothetical protein
VTATARRAILILVGLLLAGCTAGTDALSSTSTSGDRTAVATAATATTASPPTTTPSTTAPETSPPVPTTTLSAAALPGWDTWTLIYASLEIASYPQRDAEAIAATLDDAAVLRSDDYPSLNPGYWAVYGGSYGSRDEAGRSCPLELDPELSCYPRYLGPRVDELLAAGAAIVQMGVRLAVVDPATGATLRTISDAFNIDAVYPGRFALVPGAGVLFYGLGAEDSWYDCGTEKGQIRRLDLESGADTRFTAGWWPSISPDGRWLAVASAADCNPDPENADWFVAPGSQVEVFDLRDDSAAPGHVLTVSVAATNYGDPTEIGASFWDGSTGELLVVVGGDQVHRIGFDAGGPIDAAPVVYETLDSQLVGVTPEAYYVVAHQGQMTTLSALARSDGRTLTSMRTGSWLPAVAVDAAGSVLIGLDSTLILPDGRVVALPGMVDNVAW